MHHIDRWVVIRGSGSLMTTRWLEVLVVTHLLLLLHLLFVPIALVTFTLLPLRICVTLLTVHGCTGGRPRWNLAAWRIDDRGWR